MAIDPLSGLYVPLYNPRTENWKTHFEWQEDFTIVKGITEIGRATVEQLQLNRKGLINLRKALFIFGFHPPIEQN